MSARSPRHLPRSSAVVGLLLSLLLAAGLSVVALSPAAAIISPLDTATGDPAPPDGTPAPEGLDELPPVPDETIVEYPTPAGPGVVPGANTVPIAWIGTPAERPADGPPLTLQNALNTVPGGGTVSIDPNGYAFTGSLSINRNVTLASAGAATVYGRLVVSASNITVTFTDTVALGVAATGAAVSVTASNVTLVGVSVRNTNAVPRPTGVQLAAGISGVVIDHFSMDGGSELSSYGINLTTGSATIVEPDLSGIATGIVVTAAATTSGISITGGRIDAATSGISLGTANAPQVVGVDLVGVGSTGTGLDLANSRAAMVSNVTVAGFSRGIGTSTTNSGDGPSITDPTIVGTAREGIALGATSTPHVIRANITGTGGTQSTGILILKATGAIIEQPTITGTMYGITAHLDNIGVGPTITAPRVTAFGAITLGSTQGASISDAVLDAGIGGALGTGINTVNAGHVTVTNLSATGFLYAIGSQSSMPAGADRSNIRITGVTATGAHDASSGVYLLGAVDATIADVEATIAGAALVIHQSTGVNATDVVVHGRPGITSSSGGAILRAYNSTDVNVDRSSIDAGSYGFFYSDTDGSTITNATVANVLERGVYGRSVRNLDVSAVTFTGNAAVGAFVVTDLTEGISHDIAIHDNVMTGNLDGLHVLQGTTQVQFTGNTVSGQPNLVTAGGAHDLLIEGNTVAQAAGAVATAIAPLWQDGAQPGSYSSSGVIVRGNTFTGGGTWVAVGSPDPSTPDAQRRTLRDPVLVTGNVFPAASTAIQTYANAVVGEDSVAGVLRALPIVGPIAVDARDYDNPNDWGSTCRATGYLDGASYYDGGGAAVFELTVAPVVYPMNCIELSLIESLSVNEPVQLGDLVTWTLVPHNAGPRAAPAGWTITQLLPPQVELVSMTGDGYTVNGMVATAADELPLGADGPALSVVVRVVSFPPAGTAMRDVAYIAPPPPSDLDEDGFADTMLERFGPLVVPTLATDTDASPTDNDAQGVWVLAADGGSGSGGDIAATGASLGPTLALATLMLGCGLLARSRARRRLP